VATSMTAHIESVTYRRFMARPSPVARRIVQAIRKGKRGRIYTPAYWRCVMSVMRHLPSSIRRRLDF